MVVILSLPCQRMKMGLVLWIDQNTFASSLIEKVFKKRDVGFYSLPHAREFLYLVDDLRPALIVIDAFTLKSDEETFRNQYETSELLRTIPIIIIGSGNGLDYLQNKRGEIPRTLDPFQVPELLSKFLE